MGNGKGLPNARMASPALARGKISKLVVNGFNPDDLKPEDPSFLVSVGAGMNDVWQGARQIYGGAMDWHDGGHRYADITAEQNANNAIYDRGRLANGHTGIDAGRVIGSTIATLPVSGFAKGFNGVKLLSKAGGGVVLQNVGLGGLIGAASFAKDDAERAKNIGVGATFGGVGAGISAGLGKMGQKVARMTPSVRQEIANAAEGLVDTSLGHWGSPASVPPHVRQALIDETEAAYHASKTVIPQDIPRKAERVVLASKALSEGRPNAHIHQEAIARPLATLAGGRQSFATEQEMADQMEMPISYLGTAIGAVPQAYEGLYHDALMKNLSAAGQAALRTVQPQSQQNAASVPPNHPVQPAARLSASSPRQGGNMMDLAQQLQMQMQQQRAQAPQGLRPVKR